MPHKSHKSANPNHFFNGASGTNLVKGNAATSVVNVCLLRSLTMKPFTDHFSFIRKTITLCLIMTFVLSNVTGLVLAAGNESVPAFATFTTDLTQLGRQGRLRQTPNFESEIAQVLEVLGKGDGRHPVILDDNGSVQDEIVEQIALRVTKGSVPESMRELSLVKLETATLFSNSTDSSKFNAALTEILDRVVAAKGQTLLFVDDLTAFVNSANRNAPFVSAIRDRKIGIIGGSSRAAYDEKIALDGELAKMFQVISVEATKAAQKTVDAEPKRERSYRGDNVSPDLRLMMAQDATGTKRVDVIVQAKDADNPSLRALIESGEATVSGRIGRSETLVVNANLSTIESLASSGLVNYISPDREVKLQGHLETTTGTAQMRYQSNGYGRNGSWTLDGSGVGIAVIDSGITSSLRSFTEGTSTTRVTFSKSFIAGNPSTNDEYGHGTHVASIAAGSSTRNSGAYRGIAPKANLVNLRVLDENGIGTTSALLHALEWVRTNHRTHNIRVVNLSLGTPAIDSMWNDPLCYAVQDLTYYGILVVAAAGNNGKTTNGQKVYGQVHSPGNDPSVLTVGASNSLGTDGRSDDVMATYSSNGPTRRSASLRG